MSLVLAKITIKGEFPFDVEHNFPCPCCTKNHAILYINEGLMLPCADCDKKGFKLIKLPKSKFKNWIIKQLLEFF